MKKYSLKTKITGTLMLGGLLLAIIAGVVTFFYLEQVLSDQEKQKTAELTTSQARELEQIMQKYAVFSKILGTSNQAREYLQKEISNRDLKIKALKEGELLRFFSDYISSNNNYLAVYLLNKEGVALISTDSSFVGQDYSFRDYYKKGIKGEPWADMFLGKTSRQFGYYFSHPVKDEKGFVIGVVVVKVSDKEMNDSLLKGELSKTNTVMLVDHYGIVLSSTRPERFLKSLGRLSSEDMQKIKESEKFLQNEILPLQYDPVLKALVNYQGPELIGYEDVVDGEYEYLEVVKLDSYPFYIISELGMNNVENTILSTLTILISVIILIIFLITYVIYIILARFIKPIDRFKFFSEKISHGDFDFDLNVETNDEFGALAKTFKVMADKLKSLYEGLDRAVKSKTNEIQLKNTETNNQKRAILNILEDVKDEKEKIQNMAGELEKFKLALDGAMDMVLIAEPNGNVIYCNRAVERITGYKTEEVLNKKAGDLWKTPLSAEFYNNVNEATCSSGAVEIVNLRKNKESYTSSVTTSCVYNENNKLTFLVIIEHDITERKEAEEQIRSVLNGMQEQAQKLIVAKAKDEAVLSGIGEGIITTNQDGVVTYVNKSMLNMLGYESNEIIDKPVIEVLKLENENGKSLPLNKRPMIVALTIGKKTSVPLGETYYYVRKDGRRFPAGITVTPFLFNGRIVGTIEVARDITIEKDIYKAKTEFVSVASHQLKTPLSTVNWYAEMLLDGDAGELNEKQKDYVNEVYDGSKKMVALVNSLLNVSRIELGSFSIEPELVDIRSIADNSLKDLKLVIVDNKASIKTFYDDDLEKIKLDPKLIKIVFDNLLSNALKYTPVGGEIKVEIKTSNNDVLVAVSDNGFGIPQSQQAQIFTKLFRADNANTKKVSGTGLGLYIVKSIVEQTSGGKIWFESTEGKGTTFFFTLPKAGVPAKSGSVPLLE